MQEKEIQPPWIMYPGYPPGDTFWRQAGDLWFNYSWKHYWDSLSETEKNEYLIRWNVPTDWSSFYFNKDFQQWLEDVDLDK